jgi:hypothetical protein
MQCANAPRPISEYQRQFDWLSVECLGKYLGKEGENREGTPHF